MFLSAGRFAGLQAEFIEGGPGGNGKVAAFIRVSLPFHQPEGMLGFFKKHLADNLTLGCQLGKSNRGCLLGLLVALAGLTVISEPMAEGSFRDTRLS